MKMAADCIKENRDMIVGVKIRLSADCADDGDVFYFVLFKCTFGARCVSQCLSHAFVS